jgi:hypothetical protein
VAPLKPVCLKKAVCFERLMASDLSAAAITIL